jgi:hypothetical protein
MHICWRLAEMCQNYKIIFLMAQSVGTLYIITLLCTVKTCYETCPVLEAFIIASVNPLSASISYHESC